VPIQPNLRLGRVRFKHRFVELICIRWIPAYIRYLRYLGYFTNVVCHGTGASSWRTCQVPPPRWYKTATNESA
jgi:predicted CxxxxCH...CXXCH cytochrome family protein